MPTDTPTLPPLPDLDRMEALALNSDSYTWHREVVALIAHVRVLREENERLSIVVEVAREILGDAKRGYQSFKLPQLEDALSAYDKARAALAMSRRKVVAMTIPDPALVERVARAMWNDGNAPLPWRKLTKGERADFCKMAACAITETFAALRESGRLVEDDGIAAVARERQRQISVEGWTPEHDDKHLPGEMALAAACYAMECYPGVNIPDVIDALWPWEDRWWKPKDRLRNLERAGALIAAEISRLHRKGAPPATAATEKE